MQKESCIGCLECLNACPFGAIRVVPEDFQLVKCDLCGGDPECVKFCPTGAITFIDVTRMPYQHTQKTDLKKQEPGMDWYAHGSH